MLLWLAVIVAVAVWFWPSKKEDRPVEFRFPVQAPAAPAIQAAPVLFHPPPTEALARLRKQLAADEKLTPELKAAFDLIAAAIKDGGAS